MAASDPQTLITEAQSLIGYGHLTTEQAIELALLARRANTPPAPPTPPCSTPKNMGTLAILSEGASSITFSLGLPIPPPDHVVMKWGTTAGGPYPNSKTVGTGAAWDGILTDPSLVAGTLYYFVAYGLNGSTCFSALPSNEVAGGLLDTVVSDWVASSVANGGTSPTTTQQKSVNEFVLGCKADGIWTDMRFVGVFCPTAANVNTAETPLLRGTGAAKWTVNVSLDGQANDLKGLHGDPGNNVSMDTGIVPSAQWASDNDVGISIIVPDQRGLPNASGFECGGFSVDNTKGVGISSSFTGNSVGFMWNNALGVNTAGHGVGYYAINRTAANVFKMFYGKTGTPVAQIGATDAGAGLSRFTDTNLRIFSVTIGGATSNTSGSYCAFICGHVGWDAVKEQLCFNRANALRVAFGGGNV